MFDYPKENNVVELIEKVDLDFKTLSTINSQYFLDTQKVEIDLSSKQISKINSLYTNSDFINFDDKFEILNLATIKKRKQPNHNLKQLNGDMKSCSTILQMLMNHKNGWVFNEVIDPVKLNIPNYFLVIKYPMDLGTINKKLKNNYYLNQEEFAYDVRLTFSNAMIYNTVNHDVYKMAQTLSRLFEKQWKSKFKNHFLFKKSKVNDSTLIFHSTVSYIWMPY